MAKILLFLFVLIFLISLISADVIMPGYKPPTPVENIITNIADFPDYTFVGIYFSPRHRESNEIFSYVIIGSDGKIPAFGSYGHGVMSGGKSIVYAINKQDISLTGNRSEDIILLNTSLNVGKAIKLIENLSFAEYSNSVIDSDKKITREYVVSLESISGKPNKINVERSPLIYFYFAIPIIGIIVLLYVLIKRRKNAN